MFMFMHTKFERFARWRSISESSAAKDFMCGLTPTKLAANWDAVRIFLEVARIGSFRAAAGELNASPNYLKKCISVLEDAYKVTLMTRHVDSIRLTPEGLKVEPEPGPLAARNGAVLQATVAEMRRPRDTDESFLRSLPARLKGRTNSPST